MFTKAKRTTEFDDGIGMTALKVSAIATEHWTQELMEVPEQTDSSLLGVFRSISRHLSTCFATMPKTLILVSNISSLFQSR